MFEGGSEVLDAPESGVCDVLRALISEFGVVLISGGGVGEDEGLGASAMGGGMLYIGVGKEQCYGTMLWSKLWTYQGQRL